MEPEVKKPRGFAGLTPERRREIALMGARALDKSGTRRAWTSDEAREAARKSVASRKAKQTSSVSATA